MLTNADVDITVFGSHSTISASKAHCKKKGLSMKEINKAAECSSSKTAPMHYNKPIINESGSLSMTVLES